MKAITSFKDEHRFLSNFWEVRVSLDGVIYPTTEHAYQAAKTLDEYEREDIRQKETPGKAKRAGQQVTMRSDWDRVKLQVMEDLQRQKYDPDQNPELHRLLMSTGNARIVEGNTWGDVFWGMCNGVGENHLGRILMEIRDAQQVKGGLEAFFEE